MKDNTWSSPVTEVIKWVFVAVLMVAGIYANYVESLSVYVRLLTLLSALGLSGLIALKTLVGQNFLSFLHSSRVELRKVVWPTRQETIQVSIIVVIMVFIMSLILWGFDLVLFNLMAWLTGQGA